MTDWLRRLRLRKKPSDKGKRRFESEEAKTEITQQLRLVELKVHHSIMTPERAMHIRNCIKAMEDILKGGWDGRGADPS
jgi:hypothetical protein